MNFGEVTQGQMRQAEQDQFSDVYLLIKANSHV